MSFFSDPKKGGVDLSGVADVVSDKVWRAMLEGSKQLSLLGIRHVLVGGLAVGAHGWPRATKDVDFLVDDSAWLKTESGLVTMRAGLPVQAFGVAIDTLSIRDDEAYLQEALQNPLQTPQGVPVAPLEALVLLKLKSPRMKDAADIIELLKMTSAARIENLRRYLQTNARDLTEKLEALLAQARQEEEQ